MNTRCLRTVMSVVFVLMLLHAFRTSSSLPLLISHGPGAVRPEAVGTCDWPMTRYDAACTAFSPSIAPNTNATAWIADLPAGGTGWWPCPVAAEHEVLIGAGMDVTSWSEHDGSFLWSYSAPGQPGPASPVAAADGIVYFGADPGVEGRIYALNATTHAQLWSFGVAGYVGDPMIAEGRLYFGNSISISTGKVYCLNATTGEYIWDYPTQDAGVDVAVAYGKVYALCGHWESSATAAIYCLNMYDGSLVWSLDTGRDIGGTLSVANGKVYFVTSFEGWNCKVFALNATNGNEVWGTTRYSNSDAGGVAVAYGKVFIDVGYYQRGVYALNETNGDEVWAFPITPEGSVPGHQNNPTFTAVADGKVFFGVGYPSHKVYALNESTGAVIWKYNLAGYPGGKSPAIANGRVFVADHATQKLYAFEGRHYSLSITASAGGTTDPVPGNHSYLGGTNATVTCAPSLGYVLDHWDLDNASAGSADPISVAMNSNHTLQASFRWVGICNLEIYILGDAGACGTASPGPGQHAYTNGTTATIIAMLRPQYAPYSEDIRFDHWELDGINSGSSNVINVLMNVDHTLIAVFTYHSLGGGGGGWVAERHHMFLRR